MKALTLWQPWATLIAIGDKPYETRSWPTRYRGPLAIHAAKTGEGIKRCDGDRAIEQPLSQAGYSLDTLPVGVIVCTAHLTEVLTSDEAVRRNLADPFGDYSPGRFAWHLIDIRRLQPPIPATGHQGLWEWTPP